MNIQTAGQRFLALISNPLSTSKPKGIAQPPFGKTGHTPMVGTAAAEVLQEIINFSLMVLLFYFLRIVWND